MIYKILPLLMFFTFSFPTTETAVVKPSKMLATATVSIEEEVENVYNNLQAKNFSLPKLESFSKALTGFYDLKRKGIITKDILTLVDFSLSSNTKRLWVIDLSTNTVLYNSLVAHGRNTGNEFANKFSNKSESFQSSLGFYATGEVYMGKHGKSMRLDGLDKGLNDNARNRAVVMHGADYVSESFIKNNKRLGRSLGCPALPEELTSEIIDLIKDKSLLFIYHPSASPKLSSYNS